MHEVGQTYFKNLAREYRKISTICLATFEYYSSKVLAARVNTYTSIKLNRFLDNYAR